MPIRVDSIRQVVRMNREEENKRIISSTLSIVCLYCSLLIFSKNQLGLGESTTVETEEHWLRYTFY